MGENKRPQQVKVAQVRFAHACTRLTDLRHLPHCVALAVGPVRFAALDLRRHELGGGVCKRVVLGWHDQPQDGQRKNLARGPLQENAWYCWTRLLLPYPQPFADVFMSR